MTTGTAGNLAGFQLDDETLLPYSDQRGEFIIGDFTFSEPSMNSSFITGHDHSMPQQLESCSFSAPSSAPSMEANSIPSEDSDFSKTVLNYISQILLEASAEENPTALHDLSALEATEKSLFDALSGRHPSSSYPPNSRDSLSCNDSTSTDYAGKSRSSRSFNFIEPHQIGDHGEDNLVQLHSSVVEEIIPQSSSSGAFQMVHPLISISGVSGLSTQRDLALQFQKGVEEASQFLPKNNQFFIDLELKSSNLDPRQKPLFSFAETEKEERQHSPPNGYKEKKNHKREDADFEELRSSKQSAVHEEEVVDILEMFDKMLIFPRREGRHNFHKGSENPVDEERPQHHGKGKPHCHGRDRLHSQLCREGLSNEVIEKQKPNSQHTVSDDAGKAISKKLSKNSNKPSNNGSNNTSTKRAVDLRTLLVLCAQAVSTNDRRTAKDYLKQIRQHTSLVGDVSQRLAHYFANGLEARLDGTGERICNALSSKRMSAVDMLKGYHLYASSCPFRKHSNIFANHTILELAKKGASTLHIIVFGIQYGLQWPALIFRLSRMLGGAPKLRITGIEFPQPGFRPAEMVHETGHHLAKCCERFNVPFEFNAIAQKWETIQTEDLKLRHDEVIVVNSMFRFKNLLDETVALNNPRDSVLKLIRKINPNIFLQGVVNGSYSVPFFVTRFREALFHYSSLFDAFGVNLPRYDSMRQMVEKQWLGLEIMNVIACEGPDRVERPESYKQWQVRNMRAGFRQLPLDRFVMEKIRSKLRVGYHDDFLLDEDGCWMLQGWKGRILYACSCWVPA